MTATAAAAGGGMVQRRRAERAVDEDAQPAIPPVDEAHASDVPAPPTRPLSTSTARFMRTFGRAGLRCWCLVVLFSVGTASLSPRTHVFRSTSAISIG